MNCRTKGYDEIFTQIVMVLLETYLFNALVCHNFSFPIRIMMMVMAHCSQTRIVGKVDGQFLHARWWLLGPILDAHPLPQFGQTKVWDEDGRDAARSFCPLSFSFTALCLSASNFQPVFSH